MQTISHKIVTATPAPSKGRTLIFDNHKAAPTGFGLRITPKGKRSFVLRYNSVGKDRLITIGDYPAWTLTAARKRADEMKREIDGGNDILQQRRIKREEGTVEDVVEKWCRAHTDKLKSGRAVRGTLERHLVPALGDKKITEVRRRDFIQIIEALAERSPREAALLLTYCKQFMTWAEDREFVEYNPIASLRAQKVSRNMTAKPRTRVLDAEEIAALWNADEMPGMSRATLCALKFILITGQRPGEVCKASHADIQGNVWTIPKTHRGKTEDDHVVPLTDAALSVVKQAAGSTYLFERYQDCSMATSALSVAVRRCAESLDNETADAWRPHDLRRTMRTGLAAAGVSETVAELAVGHVRKGIAAVYDQHRYEREKRAALEAWERRLLQIASGEPDNAKVVPIKQTV